MLGRHLLHVVRGPSVDLGAVDVYEVGGPVAAVLVLEERGVAGHLHHVAVALHAHDEGSLAEGGQQVAGTHTGVAGILAHVDVVGAWCLVEQVVVVEEEVGVAVPVRVNHVGAGHLAEQRVGVPQGVDEGDVGIFGLQLLEDVVEVNPFSNDIDKEILNSDLLLVTSRYEGFGLAMSEANALSRPWISSNWGSILKERLSLGRNGIVIDSENPEDYANAIIDLLNDKDRLLNMKKASYEESKKLSKEVIVPKWKELLG